MTTLTLIAVLLALGLVAAGGVQRYRWSNDQAQARNAWDELLRTTSIALPERFDPSLVADLPEPARRFLSFAIAPGSRLSTVAEIRMQGELSLSSKQDPRYEPMRAQQVLAAPRGFVWLLEAGHGALRISGSDAMVDGRSWTRFWLWRQIPVVRAGGDPDHLRSSFGRMVAEAAFWTPAFLLPRPAVSWSALDQDTARATVRHLGMVQEVDIRVGPSGQPLWVRIARWSNANPDKEFRTQPFGGELSDFRSVAGYRIPFRVDGGNFFGTDDYFPFYRARVIDVQMR
jgi:hypothetical protein